MDCDVLRCWRCRRNCEKNRLLCIELFDIEIESELEVLDLLEIVDARDLVETLREGKAVSGTDSSSSTILVNMNVTNVNETLCTG